MKNLYAFALFTAALATFSVVTGNQAKAAPPPAQAGNMVVMFEGPWAFAADPKDGAYIIALAPVSRSHHGLSLKASIESNLAAGVYDLSIPTRGSAAALGGLDPSIAQIKVASGNVQRALDDRTGRYAIRLPKPEAYEITKRSRSRIGATYPPDASTEKNYAIGVSLRYRISNTNKLSLMGTPDNGTFTPLSLPANISTISFVIDPADAIADSCETHSREAFRDLTKLLNVNLYVDFPDAPGDCHNTDPQNIRSASRQSSMTLLQRVATLLGFSGGIETVYASRVANCKAPILISVP